MITPRLVMVQVEPENSISDTQYNSLKKAMQLIGLETSSEEVGGIKNLCFTGQREAIGDTFIIQQVSTQVQQIYWECQISGHIRTTVTS